MDHVIFETASEFDVDQVCERLRLHNVRVTRTSATSSSPPTIRFSLAIGPWRARWLFRIDENAGTINCSGGVTNTFFGHNVMVPRNEAIQLRVILQIVREALAGVGIAVSLRVDDYVIKRVEITHHFRLPEGVPVADAVARLARHFKALRGKASFQNGSDLHQPGTVGVGASKSKRECRAYDPMQKFGMRPRGIDNYDWDQMFALVKGRVRIEMILNARELHRSGLDAVAGWDDAAVVAEVLNQKYRKLGLTVAFHASLSKRTTDSIVLAHPTFEPYLRHWMTAGRKGHAPKIRSGSTTRFKRLLRGLGFNVNVAYAFHHFLAHGLHAVLQLGRVCRIPRMLQHSTAFARWWERSE